MMSVLCTYVTHVTHALALWIGMPKLASKLWRAEVSHHILACQPAQADFAETGPCKLTYV